MEFKCMGTFLWVLLSYRNGNAAVLENENGHLLVPIGLSVDVCFSVIFYRFWESVSLQIDFVGICSGTKTICIRVEVVGGIFKL